MEHLEHLEFTIISTPLVILKINLIMDNLM